jgi:hypothetical protein
MPTMANMTVKKADGSTDVTFTGITASGGDKQPAIWRNESFGGTIGQRPELRVRSASNGTNSNRKVEGSFTFPQLYTDTNTSLSKVATRANAQWSASVPTDMADASLSEFAAQLGNLIAHSLIKSVHSSGYSPT